MNRVLIIQGQMKQYRAPFFRKLNESLRPHGICLTVVYSDPTKAGGQNDNCDLPQDFGMKVKSYGMLGDHLVYQPVFHQVAGANLVIAEQGNRYLQNYLLVVLSLLGWKQVAFWSMGKNRDEHRSKYSEWIRGRIVKMVDWWFSYTKGGKEYFTSHGVPEERITVVQNAVDTREFSELVNSVSQAELLAVRHQFGIQEGSPVGLYCGILSRDKGISFLLQAAEQVKSKLPGFHLFVVGGGAERETIEAAARSSSWIHSVGPQFGRGKALFFRAADVFLLPGYVGLAILDAFAAGLPLLTTNNPYHRPEIEYLEHGRNGVMTNFNCSEYSEAIVKVCSNPTLLADMRQSALESSRRYSIEAMVENFRLGICSALNS
jgi:glycosyltransferase involved in cell wall biosynthesis